MAFNSRPLRDISQADIEDYARDGAVCLRNVLDHDWIDSLEPIARKVIIDRQDVGLLPTIPGRYMARCIPEYRRFVFESPIAEAAARCGCGQNLMRLRGGEGRAFRTDSGNYIADCAAESIPDPERLARLLGDIPGVVDHGLFISMASLALVGSPNGVRILELAHH